MRSTFLSSRSWTSLASCRVSSHHVMSAQYPFTSLLFIRRAHICMYSLLLTRQKNNNNIKGIRNGVLKAARWLLLCFHSTKKIFFNQSFWPIQPLSVELVESYTPRLFLCGLLDLSPNYPMIILIHSLLCTLNHLKFNKLISIPIPLV